MKSLMVEIEIAPHRPIRDMTLAGGSMEVILFECYGDLQLESLQPICTLITTP